MHDGVSYNPDTLKLFEITLDQTTSTVRMSTDYDKLGQAEAYEDLTVCRGRTDY